MKLFSLIKCKLFLLELLILFSSIYAQEYMYEPENKISYGLEISPQTMYLWHGIPLDKGLVMQPNVWVSYKNVTVELWGNAVLWDKSNYDISKNHEFDFYLYYTFNLSDDLEIVPTLNYYNYIAQEESPSTIEFSTGINYYITKSIIFKNEFFVDIYNFKNVSYSTHSIEFSAELKEGYGYFMCLECGIANKKFFELNYELSKSSFNYIKFTSEILLPISDNIKFVPFIEYNYLPLKELRDQIGKGFTNIGLKFQIE